VPFSAWSLLGCVALIACGGAPAEPPAPAPAPTAAPSPSPTEQAAPPSDEVPKPPANEACEAFASEVQTELDAERQRQKAKHATIGTWSERCGTRILVSSAVDETPVTTLALWRMGSVTKTYVAVATLRYAERGLLSLEDRLSKWFPGFPKAEAITVRHLLGHLSGIYNYTLAPEMNDAMSGDAARRYTPEELIAWAKLQPFNNEPGVAFSYSNTNYILLGRILEMVGNAPVAEILGKETLAPAKLGTTFLDGSEAVRGDLAPGFAGSTNVTRAFNLSLAWTAGAMVAPPQDMLTWLRALHIDRTLVSAALYAEMVKPFPNAGYGLGAIVLPKQATVGAGAGYGHDGSIPGYQTQAFAFPESKLAVVSVVGKSGGDANALSLIVVKAAATLRAAR
jgi:D-alanyl-D-alanine carboxypeptidase